jgi:4-coumarate--CoA ligase
MWPIAVVVMPRFDLAKFCQAVERYKVTLAHVVPPVLVLLAKDPIVSNYDLSSITHYQCGAAPLSAELSMAVSKRLNSKCVQCYGMTESSPGSHIQPLDDDSHGIVGRMLPGMTAKIVNEDGKGKFKPMLQPI